MPIPTRGEPVIQKLALLLLLSALPLPSFAHPAHGGGGHHSSSSSSSSRSSKSAGDKPVHVGGYTRKDGTYVAPYDRSSPGTTSLGGSSRTSSTYTVAPYQRNHVAPGITPDDSVQVTSHGRIKRSGAAKDAFKREHPCPANGNTSGRCPGYVIDHVNPLECGGADSPTNMQWESVAEGKSKDKTERFCRAS